jgi:hypothetical protein
MASTYSPNLRLELITTGEQQGTWGSTTNTNLGTLLEEAIGGYISVTVTDGADTTLTTNNGSADQSRNMVINLTGALTGTRNVICPAIEKLYVVKNATTGSQSVVFKVSGQTGVTIPNGSTYFLYVDGTDARQITGSMAAQNANAVSITGGSISGATVSNSSLSNVSVVANASSLSVRDSDGSNILSIAVGSNLTSNTVLTLTTGATSNRTLDISASNVTVSVAGAALIDDADASAQRTTLGLGTSDSPQFTAVNIGNATDTTITRVSAGVIAVEGKNVVLNGTTETFTTGTIELGAVSDTTLSRSAAGVLAVEGNPVPSPASQAHGDVLYRGASNWERLAAGTSGQFLQTAGANAAPTWATVSTGGMTLLGTITTTSGGSAVLSGLTLTNYDMLCLVFRGVSGNFNPVSILLGTSTADDIVVFSGGGISDTISGMIFIDLTIGTIFGGLSNVSTSTANLASSCITGDTAITTAATQISIALANPSFDAGSVLVYGIQ